MVANGTYENFRAYCKYEVVKRIGLLVMATNCRDFTFETCSQRITKKNWHVESCWQMLWGEQTILQNGSPNIHADMHRVALLLVTFKRPLVPMHAS
ncbi:hypothetical protein AVEN_159430-1 [Araneus ventricosus]|uniref:Uncharacterized protein n=1 Tax=Araneus ventricosus TaxID=182803 RepID=A0A4Y2A0V3_ARAVE|nr:hypothetical protein AVEN_159430-1 [Araneus ventricosus]